VRRIIFVLLAVALWFAVWDTGARSSVASLPAASGSAQERQARPADFAPPMITSTGGASQTRLPHDLLAHDVSSVLAGFSFSAAVSPLPFRLHISRPLRSLPLLI
jgi:hypothetical protein